MQERAIHVVGAGVGLDRRGGVVGEQGTFAVPGDDGQTEHLLAGRTPRTEGPAWGRVPEAGWGWVHGPAGAVPIAAEAGRWPDFYSDLAAAVLHGSPPPVDPWEAVGTLAVLDAARRSASTGEVVHVPLDDALRARSTHPVR